MDLDLLRVGRERLSHVFQYLEALNQHRNPAKRQIREQLWTLWLKDLPAHPSIERGNPHTLAETKTGTTGGPSEDDGQDFILRVSRAKLTRPPDPPTTLKTWLENAWDDPSKDISSLREKASWSRATRPKRCAWSDPRSHPSCGRSASASLRATLIVANNWKRRRNNRRSPLAARRGKPAKRS